MSASLSAATQDRKARLAQLKSLKRKQDDTPSDDLTSSRSPKSPRLSSSHKEDSNDTSRYLSGRNYDAETKGPRLGFETAPQSTSKSSTIEARAAALAAEIKAQALKEAEEEAANGAAGAGGLDLFKLQPRKPNWDLKRNLEQRLEKMQTRTDNALARLVRERIEAEKMKANTETKTTNGGAAKTTEEGQEEENDVGLEGATLVEATRERQREDEEDARRERELDKELEGS